jgi:pimeloyl-ACP methyl ester carboxylesterase
LAADAARQRRLRLLAVDRLGFGQSTFLAGRTIGGWAADVAELADRLELERFAVVGVSGGGSRLCSARRIQDDRVKGPWPGSGRPKEGRT